jgi:hypothetical protein
MPAHVQLAYIHACKLVREHAYVYTCYIADIPKAACMTLGRTEEWRQGRIGNHIRDGFRLCII